MTGEPCEPSPRTPIVETTIGAPFDVVWHALRDPAELRRWHGWEYDGLDDEIEQIYGGATTPSRADGTIQLAGIDHRFEVDRRSDDETVVRVTKPGPGGNATWDEIEQGWITFIQQLRYFLERHRGEDRRTATLKANGGPPLTPAATALPELEEAEVFFESRFQAGLALRAPKGALAVLHAPPDGGGRIILSTYGVSDAEVESLRNRWSSALAVRYEEVEP